MPETAIPCFFKSTQQAIGPQQILQLVVYCPETSHDSVVADAKGQIRKGCPYYHDKLKKCRIDMAISYGSMMYEQGTLTPKLDKGQSKTA